MKSRISFIAFLCAFYAQSLTAQQELGLHFLNNVWESSLTNPAFTTDKKLTIILPSAYFNLGSPDLTIRDLTYVGAAGNVLNFDTVVSRLKNQTTFNGNVNVQTLGIAFKVKKWTFSLSHDVHVEGYTVIPKQLAQAVVYGNSQFIGQTASIGVDVQSYAYSALSLGAAYQVNPNLTIGARVKYLSGLAGIFTPSNQVNIFTDPNAYKLTFTNNYDLRTYSLSSFTDINNNLSSFVTSKLFSSNNGFAFDLGGHLKLGKLELAASLIDIGASINWSQDAKSYKSQGTYTYTGATASAASKFFSLYYLTDASFTDTLKKVVNLIQGSDSYTSKLPMKAYLSGAYQLNDNFRLSALIYNEGGLANASGHTDLSLGANYRVFKALTLGAVYSLRNTTFDNLGVNAVLNLGPVQLYAVTDNISGVLNPYGSKSANGRIGLNLAF